MAESKHNSRSDKSIFGGFLATFFGGVGEFLLGIMITPVLVRVLGQTGYGDFAVIISIVGFLILFIDAGTTAGLRKYLPEQRDEKWEEHVFGFFFRLGLLIAGIFSTVLIFLAASGIAASIFSERFEIYFYLIAAYFVVEVLFLTARGTLMGFGLEHRSEPLVVFRKFTFAVFGIGLAYLGFGVVGVVIGDLIGALLAAFVGLYVLRSRVNFTAPLRRSPETLPTKEFMSFNYGSLLLGLLLSSLYHVDILMIQYFLGSDETAIYKSALVVAEFLWFAPFAIQLVFVQSAASMWAEGDYNRITSLASTTTRYVSIFTLLLAIGVAVLAEPFLRVYFGPQFTAGATPLLILIPGALGFAIARPMLAIGQAKGDLRPLIVGTGGAAAVNLLLNGLLIPSYGILGAAAATSIGYGLMLVTQIYAARHIGFDPIANLRLPRVISTAAVTLLVLYTISLQLSSDLFSLLLVPPIGLVVYFGVALMTGSIRLEEVRLLLERLPYTPKVKET